MSAGRAPLGPGESASPEDSPPDRAATSTTAGEARPMAKKHRPRADQPASKPRPGEIAQAQGRTLNSYRLGAQPILQRLRLEEFLGERLPAEDPRTKVATATGLLLLIKNLLISREPLYGVG